MSLVAAEQSQDLGLWFVVVIPIEQEAHNARTYVFKIAVSD